MTLSLCLIIENQSVSHPPTSFPSPVEATNTVRGEASPSPGEQVETDLPGSMAEDTVHGETPYQPPPPVLWPPGSGSQDPLLSLKSELLI